MKDINIGGVYSVKDISEAIDVSEETVRRWIRSGALPANQSSRKDGSHVAGIDLLKFLDTKKPKKRKKVVTVDGEGCDKCYNIEREVEPLTDGIFLTGGPYDSTIIHAQAWLVDNEGPCLDFWTTNSQGDTLTDENIPINYCPFCGRRLRK